MQTFKLLLARSLARSICLQTQPEHPVTTVVLHHVRLVEFAIVLL